VSAIKDPYDLWLESIESPNTRNVYGPYLKKLFTIMGETSESMLERLKSNPREVWREAWVKTREPALTPKGREITLCAFKHFMRFSDIDPPTGAKIVKAPKGKRSPNMTWGQALKICYAAPAPYRWIFRLQLHCGWGIAEFLQFNANAQNWEQAQNRISDGVDFFRFEFPGRKPNGKPFYTLIPTFVLKEILEANSKFPLTTTRGKPLDLTNYHSSVVLIESAFRNAITRAALKLDPPPSPHEFQLTFKTHCTRSGVDREVSEFAIGHKLDPRGYEKCQEDMDFVWSELKKAFGPAAPDRRLLELEKENQRLQAQIDELKADRGFIQEDVARMVEAYLAKR